MAQEQMEEYLETIYDLEGKDGAAKTTAIAKCMKIAPATVTEAIKNLSEKGFVQYEPYRGVTLTEKGQNIADMIKRKHRLLEVFLSNVLHINQEKIHEEACKMEHTISAETENALCRMLDAPAHCPHGSPISPCNKEVGSCTECDLEQDSGISSTLRDRKIVPITDLAPEQKGLIAFIRGDCKVVQRLSDLGLTLGTPVAVTRKTHMNGPVEVSVRRTKLAIDRTIAENIFVDASGKANL
jgi:DtxR family transcriptional regulator, Mn-dependent transcriptional regulator